VTPGSRPSHARARRVCVSFCVTLVASCASHPRAPRPPKYPRSPQQQAGTPISPSTPLGLPLAEPVDPRRAALLETGEVIVGNRLGLEAWKPDGSSRRVISPGPAFHPRRFGRDHVLVLRPISGFDVRDGAVFEMITLANGERRELAQLPPFRCAEQRDPTRPQPSRLDVEDPSDFEVHLREGVVCLGLMDATSRYATVRVRARVELAVPRVDRWLVLGESECTPPPDVQAGDPAADGTCWGIAKPAITEPDPAAFPYTFDEEHVRMPAAPRGGAKLQVRGYQIEQSSPSGRWLLLTGDYTERDATYRRLLLLDRTIGKLFPLIDRAGGWPGPLTAAGAKLKTPIKQAQLIPNLADVRWLGDSDRSELLLLDALVLRPGAPAFELPEGEVTR
jgi:hypothetical protein